jgi:hypothetical protein
LQNSAPTNPYELIEWAALDGIPGEFEYSSDFLTGGTAFVTSPISVADDGNIEAWEADDLQKVGDASMWSARHQMTNASNDVPPALNKLVFVRGGMEWKNNIPIDFGVDLDFVLLSMIENAGTRGDSQGTVPVIRFDNGGAGYTPGAHVLQLTFRHPGHYSIGLKATATSSGDESMKEIDLIIT